MKKNAMVFLMILSLLMMIFLPVLSTAEGGLLPSLTETVGIAMPSLGEALGCYPDNETENEDGSVTELYANVSESDFNIFSVYLQQQEAELADYKVEKGMLTAEIRAKGAAFSLSYNSKSGEARVTYPSGTFDEWVKNAKTHFDAAQKLLAEEKKDEAYAEIFAIPQFMKYGPVDRLMQEDENFAAVAAATAREARYAPYREAGNVVTFGTYPQTKEGTDQTPIEWIVLDYDEINHKALLISKYGLDAVPYNKDWVEISYEQCTLRAWLNGEFLKKAFSTKEQSAILITNVDNSSVYGDKNTQDQIFLLNNDEAYHYFGGKYDESNIKARVAPTDYAIAQGAYNNDKYLTADGKPAGLWWLRDSLCYYTASASRVFSDGSRRGDSTVDDGALVVRPAFWLNLDADNEPEKLSVSREETNESMPDTTLEMSRTLTLDLCQTPGSIVTIGTYPQTAEGNDQTPIEWIVLDYDETNHKTLLISKYALDAVAYHYKVCTAITWEQCTLRAWLNDEFLKKAFSAKEQSAILVTNVDNSSGQGYSEWRTKGGNNTQDRIFLLSYAEAKRYLGVTYRSNIKSRVAPTEYAVAQDAITSNSDQTADGNPAGWWWLRSPGQSRNLAAYVFEDGSIHNIDVHTCSNCVRPVFWLNLEADIF